MIYKKPLSSAIEILHSLLLVVFTAFLFDSVIFATLFNNKFIDSIGGRIFFLVLIPLRVYFCAGIYGMIVEIVSGEERVITRQRFEANAKQFWPLFLVLSSVTYLVSLACTIAFNDFRLPIHLISTQTNFFVLFILASAIIHKKYGSPAKTKKKLPLFVLFQFLGLYAGGLCLVSVSLVFQEPTGYLNRVIIFVLKYLIFLEFIFFCILQIQFREDIHKKFTFEKEFILVNPTSPGVLLNLPMALFSSYPAGFLVLQILTPQDYKIRVFNRVVWQKRYYDSNKLVGITCFTANSPEAYKIAKEFRRRGNKVIMGGPHVNFLPDEALAFCDSVVIGEAEGVWKKVLQDYENGCLEKKYYGEPRDDYYAEVHEGLLQSPPEVLRDCLEISRGCKYKCHFCTIPAFSQRKIRRKPLSQVVELINRVKPKFKQISFLDNNIYAEPAFTRELVQALIPLKVKWGGQCSIDIAANEQLLALLPKSGCDQLLIGYEIADSSPEQKKGGKFAMSQRYVELSKRIKKQGIGIKAHFIFGFDSDSFRSLWNLWKCAFKINPWVSVVTLLTPFPGTAFYYEVLNEDRLTNLNWRNYSIFRLVFKPKKMNARFVTTVVPLIYMGFLFTTCKLGYFLLGFVFALYGFLKMLLKVFVN